ncbi:hypothetical protein Lal_00025193 [Lupinus albus]|nr:hypothetical protein Lal_00025193 [Lupinus albus]
MLQYFGVKIARPWKFYSKTFLCASFARSLVKFNGLNFEDDSPCLDLEVLGLLEEEAIVGFEVSLSKPCQGQEQDLLHITLINNTNEECGNSIFHKSLSTNVSQSLKIVLLVSFIDKNLLNTT